MGGCLPERFPFERSGSSSKSADSALDGTGPEAGLLLLRKAGIRKRRFASNRHGRAAVEEEAEKSVGSGGSSRRRPPRRFYAAASRPGDGGVRSSGGGIGPEELATPRVPAYR
jgi:hypothetical protein